MYCTRLRTRYSLCVSTAALTATLSGYSSQLLFPHQRQHEYLPRTECDHSSHLQVVAICKCQSNNRLETFWQLGNDLGAFEETAQLLGRQDASQNGLHVAIEYVGSNGQADHATDCAKLGHCCHCNSCKRN